MAHAVCTLDNSGYKHALGTRNTYCFFTESVVTRTRLIIMFIRTLAALLLTIILVTRCETLEVDAGSRILHNISTN